MKRILLACFLSVVALQLQAQDHTITGKVKGVEDNSPLPGVNVFLEGTTIGTITDAEGSYSMSVPDKGGVLVFSFLGFVTEKRPVSSETTMDVALSPDVTSLQEVVVVGYGTVKKTDLTGSVSTIDPEVVTKRGSTSALEGMQGQATGVDISNSSGRAGAPFKIQIRGQQSLNGGNPLYVVDGVITDNIDFLNPQDIERIDILKDASSTAIYGSRGAYGVVLVTTKRGASVKQKAVISYDGYTGIRKAVRMPDFMSGDKWFNFRQDSYITGVLQSATPNAYDANTGKTTANATDPSEIDRRLSQKDFTNWPSLLLQTGTQMNHYVTVSGMSDNKLGYVIGAGFQQEKGNIVHEDYKRYNFKANINHSLNEHWNAGTGMNLSIADRESGSPNAIVEAFRMPPLLKPTYTSDPTKLIIQPGKDYPYTDFTSSVNPLYELEHASQSQRTFNAIGNLYLEYIPVKWLSVKTNFQPRFKYDKVGNFTGMNTELKIGIAPDANFKIGESFSYVWDNQIVVNKKIKDHSFNAMGLYSMNLFRDETFSGSATKLPFNSSFYNLGSADPTNQRAGSAYAKSNIMSYAIRVNYSWKDKYLLTLSNRWDGASVLSSGNKWASFPSAAVAWKISDESFLSGIKAINSLKARVSYGITGSNQAVRPYDSQPLASTITLYDFGGTAALGYAPGSIISNNLTWEKVKEVDAGVDFSLFSARITGSVDYYNKLTDGVIYKRRLPLEIGGYFDPTTPDVSPIVKDNVGKVRNEGIEIGLNTVNVSTTNFTWSTSFNFSKNKNSIVELQGKNDDVGNKWFIGYPINVNYNYVFDGVIQQGDVVPSGQLVGQAKVKDFDGNGVITPADRRILGSPMPKWIGGMSSTLAYKNFDLSASVYTRQGVQVYSYFHEEFMNLEDRGRAKLNFDWYMPENNVTQTRVSNDVPQPKNGGRFWNTEHVGFYRDASFVKIKNITLGYNFSAATLERIKLKSLRVYFNVLNPFTFTKYNGFDPEWADAQFTPTFNNPTSGSTANNMVSGGMSSTTYQLGVNAKF